MKHLLLTCSLFATLALFSIETVIQAQQPGEQPRVVKAVAPTYPRMARRIKAEMKITIEVTISNDGLVTETKVAEESSNKLKLLLEVSEKAAKRWVFSPAKTIARRTARLAFVFKAPSEPEVTTASFLPPYLIEVE